MGWVIQQRAWITGIGANPMHARLVVFAAVEEHSNEKSEPKDHFWGGQHLSSWGWSLLHFILISHLLFCVFRIAAFSKYFPLLPGN